MAMSYSPASWTTDLCKICNEDKSAGRDFLLLTRLDLSLERRARFRVHGILLQLRAGIQ